MDRIMVAVAIGMALVFAAGVILGFLVTISMASNREDRLGTLTRQACHITDEQVRMRTSSGCGWGMPCMAGTKAQRGRWYSLRHADAP